MATTYTLSDLTIIVPGKDAQASIEKTLNSLEPLMAAGGSCILVNDGSTDATGEIMGRFATTWDKAQLIGFETGGGAGKARNAGLGQTRTALVGSVDSDDWVGAEYYPALVAQMNADPEVDFVRSHYLECRGNKRNIIRAPFEVVNTAFDPRLAVMPDDRPTMVDHPQMWAGIYAMDFLDRHDIRYDPLHTAEDRIINWKTQILGRKMVVAEEFRFYYRRDHNVSLTAVGDDRQLDFLQAMQNVIGFLVNEGHERYLPKAIRQLLALICFHIERQGRLEPATRKKLVTGAAHLLALVPTRELEAALLRIDDTRRNTIRGLI